MNLRCPRVHVGGTSFSAPHRFASSIVQTPERGGTRDLEVDVGGCGEVIVACVVLSIRGVSRLGY